MAEQGNENTGEEVWKDDDFLSFGGNSNEQQESDNDDENDAAGPEDEGNSNRANGLAADQLPPWMDQYTDFRYVAPLVALHNEIVGFCNLMSPMPQVSYTAKKLWRNSIHHLGFH